MPVNGTNRESVGIGQNSVLDYTEKAPDGKLRGEFPTKHLILIIVYYSWLGNIGTAYIMFPPPGRPPSFF
jgi:hypothetical protein